MKFSLVVILISILPCLIYSADDNRNAQQRSQNNSQCTLRMEDQWYHDESGIVVSGDKVATYQKIPDFIREYVKLSNEEKTKHHNQQVNNNRKKS